MNAPRRTYAFTIIVTFAGLALLGLCLLPLLPLKLAPAGVLPRMVVAYSLPGASARTVEADVTLPVESLLGRLDGVVSIESQSADGRGRVIVDFDTSTDLDDARLEASMLLRNARAAMPQGIVGPAIAFKGAAAADNAPAFTFAVTAPPSAGVADIRRACSDKALAPLADLADVDRVECTGDDNTVSVIECDPQALDACGVDAAVVARAVSAAASEGYATVVSDGRTSLSVAVTAPCADSLELSRIFIPLKGGGVVALSRLASLSRREGAPSSAFRMNGTDAAYLNVYATPGANVIDLASRIDARLPALRDALPEGYGLTLVFDGAEQIRAELRNVLVRTALTVLILLVFVALCTRSLSYVAIVAICLAVTQAVAFIFYRLLGVEIQLYSLAGICISLNLVIDNIIVMAGNVAAGRGRRGFTAILAATLTTVGALSVIFFLDRVLVVSLRDFALVVAVNLAVSLAVALFLVPALALRLDLRRRSLSPRFTSALRTRYDAILPFIARRRLLVMRAFALVFAWSLKLFIDDVRERHFSFTPPTEAVVRISARLPEGATFQAMDGYMRRMEAFVAAIPAVAMFRTEIQSPRNASIEVRFKGRDRSAPYVAAQEIIRMAQMLGGPAWHVDGLPGTSFENEIRSDIGALIVELKGYEYGRLNQYASALRDSLMRSLRIKEVRLTSSASVMADDYSRYHLRVSADDLARDSISFRDFAAAMANSGEKRLVDAGHSGEVMVTLGESVRDAWALANTPIAAGGKTIRPGRYFNIAKEQAPQEIVRKNQEYLLYLHFDYIGDASTGKAYVDKCIAENKRALQPGYAISRLDFGHDSDSDSTNYPFLLVLIGLIAFFLAAILFNSLRMAIAIILLIPASLSGLFLTFRYITPRFDEGGFAAMILLAGITVNAGIYLADAYLVARRSENASPVRAYAKAVRQKAEPVAMTVVSTLVGFIPFLIGPGEPYFWFALAAGTIGGMLMSLPAIALLLPAMILPASGKRKSSARKLLGNNKNGGHD